MKKTILGISAAMLLLPAIAFGQNCTTTIKSYNTTREEAKALVDRVSNGYGSQQNVVLKKGKKGLTQGIAYNEDVLAVEYANLVPVEVEDNSAPQVAPPQQKPAVAKQAVKSQKKAKRHAAVKSKASKKKAYAYKGTKAKKHRHYANYKGKKGTKVAAKKEMVAQTVAPQKKTKTIYRPQGRSQVVLEQASAVYVPGQEALVSESQYVIPGPNAPVVKTH